MKISESYFWSSTGWALFKGSTTTLPSTAKCYFHCKCSRFV